MNPANTLSRYGCPAQVVMLDQGISPESGGAFTTGEPPAIGRPQALAWSPAHGLVLMELPGGSRMVVALPEIHTAGKAPAAPRRSATLPPEFSAGQFSCAPTL